MPPVCSHCKEIGHSVKRCKLAPVSCSGCKSTAYSLEGCPRRKKKKTMPYRVKAAPPTGIQADSSEMQFPLLKETGTPVSPNPALKGQILIGETSASGGTSAGVSGAEADSSDISSSFSDSSESDDHEDDDFGFTEVVSSRQRRRERGASLKLN